MLLDAEKKGTINLNGDEDEETRKLIVEKRFSLIDTNTPTEKVRDEVDLINYIPGCMREALSHH